LDRFLCRVHSQLCDALARHEVADLETYLIMLGDYLHYCPTRVMASQVIEVTMETLLHIKVLRSNSIPGWGHHLTHRACSYVLFQLLLFTEEAEALQECQHIRLVRLNSLTRQTLF
jgi:hypothetical protein